MRPDRLFLLAPMLFLAGCALPSPPSAADDAEQSACAAQADATYQTENPDIGSRTAQNGLLYPATPNQVFDAQRLGSLHQRDSAIADCLRDGTAGNGSANAAIPGPPPAAPQIIQN
jgi:hypothetical protein